MFGTDGPHDQLSSCARRRRRRSGRDVKVSRVVLDRQRVLIVVGGRLLVVHGHLGRMGMAVFLWRVVVHHRRGGRRGVGLVDGRRSGRRVAMVDLVVRGRLVAVGFRVMRYL